MFGLKRPAQSEVRTQARLPELPYQVTRLSFQSKDEYDSYRKQHPKVFEQVWFWQMHFGNKPDIFTFPGICEVCDAVTNFSAIPRPNNHEVFRNRVQWWESATCEKCRMSQRDRAIARTLIESVAVDSAIHHLGHFSNLRKWLNTRYPHSTVGHFSLENMKRTVAGDLGHQSSAAPPHTDGSLDLIISVEVLEYVPDVVQSLAEYSRVLRNGGRALLAVPWVGQEKYEHLVRAELHPDGSIQNFEPASYHRDAESGEEFLRLRAFGWKVLDDLRQAGFSSATAEYLFAPVHGYMTLHPIICAIK